MSEHGLESVLRKTAGTGGKSTAFSGEHPRTGMVSPSYVIRGFPGISVRVRIEGSPAEIPLDWRVRL